MHRTVSPTDNATPSIVCVPDSAMLDEAKTRTDCLGARPCATLSTYCLLAASVPVVGSLTLVNLKPPSDWLAVNAVAPSGVIGTFANLVSAIAAAEPIWASTIVPAIICVLPRICVVLMIVRNQRIDCLQSVKPAPSESSEYQ